MPADYVEKWQEAKEKFETDTGLKRPQAKNKVLFVKFKKPSGVEEALKEVAAQEDKGGFDTRPEKFYTKWEELLETLDRKKKAYLDLLNDAIEGEPDKTDKYRALKIFKAELETIATRAASQYKTAHTRWLSVKDKEEKMTDSVENVINSLRSMGASLKSSAAKATLFCKEVLAEATPAKYNSGRLTAARNMRQYITNIKRYVYTDYVGLLVNPDLTGTRDQDIAIVDDPRMVREVQRISAILGPLQGEIQAMAAKTGDSATNGSLEFLGTYTDPLLPNNATEADVKAAVKHLAAIVKRCQEIGATMERFGL